VREAPLCGAEGGLKSRPSGPRSHASPRALASAKNAAASAVANARSVALSFDHEKLSAAARAASCG
jgi:hypothetical protein